MINVNVEFERPFSLNRRVEDLAIGTLFSVKTWHSVFVKLPDGIYYTGIKLDTLGSPNSWKKSDILNQDVVTEVYGAIKFAGGN